MPAPLSNTGRTPGAGETWRTRDQSGEKVQVNIIEDEDGNALFEEAKPGAVELRDTTGAQAGVPGNPLHVEVTDPGGAATGTNANPFRVEPPLPSSEYVTPDGTRENERVVKAAPGKAYVLEATLDPTIATPHYLFVYDQATLPPVAANLVRRLLIPPAGRLTLTYPRARPFLAGITVAISTDDATFTAPVPVVATFFAEYD